MGCNIPTMTTTRNYSAKQVIDLVSTPCLALGSGGFWLEHVVAERDLARNNLAYRDAFGLLVPLVAMIQTKPSIGSNRRPSADLAR
jgi:hypothetical protein